MSKFLLLLVTTAIAHNISLTNLNVSVPRIVGGRKIDISLVPYTTAIFEKDIYLCVGSYIKSVWILTAAHCVEHLPEKDSLVGNSHVLDIKMGITNLTGSHGQTRKSLLGIVHPRYNRLNHDFDIGLIRISKQFHVDATVAVTQLIDRTMVYDYKVATVSGWGYTKYLGEGFAHTIETVEVSIVPRKKCEAIYGTENITLSEDVICAGCPNKDSCHGDSGAALILKTIGLQIGLVSWGLGCGDIFPGVYTDVYYHRTWISNQTDAYANYTSATIRRRFRLYMLVVLSTMQFV